MQSRKKLANKAIVDKEVELLENTGLTIGELGPPMLHEFIILVSLTFLAEYMKAGMITYTDEVLK